MLSKGLGPMTRAFLEHRLGTVKVQEKSSVRVDMGLPQETDPGKIDPGGVPAERGGNSRLPMGFRPSGRTSSARAISSCASAS